MAETALSLAQSMVETVLGKLTSAVLDKIGKLLSVRQNIQNIKDELQMMQAFLKTADQGGLRYTEVVRTLVKQVRELAYDTEDCLEEFMLHFQQRTNLVRKICNLRARHRIATEIQDIESRIEALNQRFLQYIAALPTSSNVAPGYVHIAPHLGALSIEDGRLVGLDKPKADLIKWITEKEKSLRVISVVGMGGIGKTTLVKKVYASLELAYRFNRHAWITVSQSFEVKEILKNLIRQFHNAPPKGIETKKREDHTKEIETMGGEELTQKIQDKLQNNRYLIVLDDVWTVPAWEVLKPALPDNNNGSRIVVTTRNATLAAHCSTPSTCVYQLQPLSDEESLKLLCTMVYKSSDYPCLPKELHDLASNILKKCRGLPLAIVAVGGLLATKPQTTREWQKLHDQLGSELETNLGLEGLKRVLNLSYSDLPYYLKPCFLYLSVFPEDSNISRKRLVKRWMAEGFVSVKRDMTAEEVAERYFYELVHRNLILPVESISAGGIVKQCRVHDVMLEVILSKSLEENLVFVLSSLDVAIPRDKVRNLLLANGWSTKENALKHMNLSHVRSLTVSGEWQPSLVFPRLRLLRVLDLEDASVLQDEDFRQLGRLRHLKYLSLRGLKGKGKGRSNVQKLPNSCLKLRGLEVLDIRGTRIKQLPAGIVKLQKLRYLHAGVRFDDECSCPCCFPLVRAPITRMEGVMVPKGIGKMKGLETLSAVVVGEDKGIIEELGKLTQLRKFGIVDITKNNGEEVCAAVGKLRCLQSLLMSAAKKETLSCLTSFSPPPRLLNVTLNGGLASLPNWFASLGEVAKITLVKTKLTNNAMTVLQGLPNLLILRLWNDSYIGGALVFGGKTFMKLEMLELAGLSGLEVVFKEQAMPKLERISVRWCTFSTGISGIEHLPGLKEISLNVVYILEAMMDELQRQVDRHHNHPTLKVLGSELTIAQKLQQIQKLQEIPIHQSNSV
uniref:Disease resistance protein RPM1-like n=1 Tax=Ananas comosus var. bracteatus TaxID=296719 RepID=A0A6V7QW08_ANACO